MVDSGSSCLALCPVGGDSRALSQGLWIHPGEAGDISQNNTLCFLSTTDPRAELQPPRAAFKVRALKWEAAHRSVP